MKNYRVSEQEFIIDYKENKENSKLRSKIYQASNLPELLENLEFMDEDYDEEDINRFDRILESILNIGGFWTNDYGCYWEEPERHEYTVTANYITISEVSEKEIKLEEEKKKLKNQKLLEENSIKWNEFLIGKDLDTLKLELKKYKFPTKIK